MKLDDFIHPVTFKAKLIIALALLGLAAIACYLFGVLVFIGIVLVVGSIGLLVVNKTHPEVIKRLFGTGNGEGGAGP